MTWVPVWKVCASLQSQGRLGACPPKFVTRTLAAETPTDPGREHLLDFQQQVQSRPMVPPRNERVTRSSSLPISPPSGQNHPRLRNDVNSSVTVWPWARESRGKWRILRQLSVRWQKRCGKIFLRGCCALSHTKKACGGLSDSFSCICQKDKNLSRVGEISLSTPLRSTPSVLTHGEPWPSSASSCLYSLGAREVGVGKRPGCLAASGGSAPSLPRAHLCLHPSGNVVPSFQQHRDAWGTPAWAGPLGSHRGAPVCGVQAASALVAQPYSS